MSAAEAETNDDRPDRRIGSYRLVQPLGSGGMSSVFRAVHVETGLEVAVKVLPRSLAKNPTTLQRFLREAKSAEALEHSNIVAIYDRGVDQGRYYLVLEYIHGGDLHDWVRANGPMAIDQALKVVRDVVEGLRYAALQGVIHRDIKPANLLLSDAGLVKITDLGLAIHSVEEDERVTREGTTVGTVDYMSPEQARDSRATSARSDMYSLGCTFFFLLTAKPPYPGGDVAEKLAKHCTAPPVDPRSVRPDVPNAVARLVLRMTAKRPENRFADYDELLAAIDKASGNPGSADDGEAPLDALIVDDEEEDDDGPDSAIVLTLANPETEARAKKKNPPPAAPRPEVSMADLAELDAAPVLTAKKPVKPAPTASPQVPIKRGENLPAHDALFDADAADDEFAMTGSMPGAFASGSSRKMTDAERSWITALVLGGLGLIVMVIAVDQLIKASRTEEVVPVVKEEDAGPVNEVSSVGVEPARVPIVAISNTPLKNVGAVAKKAASISPVVVKPPFVEPTDPLLAMIPETAFPAGTETAYRPDWAAAEVATHHPGKFTIVRRFGDAGEVDQKSSIREALDVAGGGTIEIADDGPFFENDLHFGEPRVIRARAGFRPIICLTRPKSEETRAFLELGERSLTFDGVDLVVDASDLLRNPSLFGCGGGSLTLHNCTVTVMNRNAAPFWIVTTRPGEKTSRIRFERCTFRGAFLGVAELSGGPADVVLSRSLIFNGLGAAFSVVGSANAGRGLYLSRSICATRGPLIEVLETPGGMKARRLTVRALGNLLAHFATPNKTGLMLWRGNGAGAAEMVSWQGDRNTLQGWSDWLSVGSGRTVRVTDLAAARAVWPGTDPNSTEESVAWPLPQTPVRIFPDDLRTLAKGKLDTLNRVAVPSPWLLQKTIEPFPKVFVPAIENGAEENAKSANVSGPAPRALVAVAPAGVPSAPLSKKFGTLDRSPKAPNKTSVTNLTLPDGLREITLDTETAPYLGDLGRVIADSILPGDRLVRVQVSGSSQRVWTPIRMPDGVSLEVIVTPDINGSSPSWTTPGGVSGEGLIDVRNAGLKLVGVSIERDGAPFLKHLVRVERGHLVLQRCHLRGPGRVEPGGGKLVAFIARESQPLEPHLETGTKPVVTQPAAPRFGPAAPKAVPIAPATPPVPSPWPFTTLVNRPTFRAEDCILSSGGNAVEANLGRGLVAFLNSVVVSGDTAFALEPSKVARIRFDADLSLDHCSITAERSLVALGAWPGSDPGPDRPWLVASQRSAFVANYERPEATSVLLKADPLSIAHGTIFWQSNGDAFEVPVYASTDRTSSTTSGGSLRRLDVNIHWAQHWGEAHFRNVIGPTGASGTPGNRLFAPLRPGMVEPFDLALDPKSLTGRPYRDLGADFAKLGVSSSNRGGRRR